MVAAWEGEEARLFDANWYMQLLEQGLLAMPLAMSHFGIMLGVILILWCGLTSAFGLYPPISVRTLSDRGTSSFFALSQINDIQTRRSCSSAASAVKCFGAGVSHT